jgi:hypothetical protein
MDELKAFLINKVGADPVRGQNGILTESFPVCSIQLASGTLCICDTSYPPGEDGCEPSINLQPGEYQIAVTGIAYGRDKRIASMRCLSRNAGNCTYGREIGEVPVDAGRVMVGDLQTMLDTFDGLDDDDEYDNLFDDELDAFLITAKNGNNIAVLSAGFGDGSYPVRELVHGGKVVGVEIVFIHPEEVYPFDQEKIDPKVVHQFLDELSSKLAVNSNPARSQKEALVASVQEMLAEREKESRKQAEEFRAHLIMQRLRAPVTQANVTKIADRIGEKPEIQSRKTILESFGYQYLGTYEHSSIKNYFFLLFLHQTDGTIAYISSNPKAEINSEFQADYPDGTEFNLNDSQPPSGISPAPWQTVVFEPNLPLPDLLNRFRKLRPTGNILETKTGVVDHITKSFHRLQQWRLDRGGWNRDEVRQQLKLSDAQENQDKITESTMNVRERWLFAWFKEENPQAAKEHFQTVLIVHDELEYYIAQIYWVMGTGKNLNFRELTKDKTIRNAFSQANAAHGSPLQLIAQKTSGFQADFYVPR